MMMTRVRNALKIANRLNDREMFILGCALENLINMLHSKNNHGKMRADERPDNGWRTLENDTHVQFDLESGEIISGPEALVGAKFEKNEKGKTVAKKPDGSEVGWKGLKKGESGSNNGNESESNSKYKSKIKFTDNFFENRNALDALAAGTVIKVNGQTYEKSEDNFTEWINTETGELVYGIQIANSNYGAEVEVDKSKPEIAREKKEKEAQDKQKQIEDSYESSIDKSTKINPKHMNKNYTILSSASVGRELYFKQDGKAYKFVKGTNDWIDAVTGERVSSYAMTDRLQGLSRANWMTKVVAGEATDVYFNKLDIVKKSKSQSGVVSKEIDKAVETLDGARTGSIVEIGDKKYQKRADGNWEQEGFYARTINSSDEVSKVISMSQNDAVLTTKEDIVKQSLEKEKSYKSVASNPKSMSECENYEQAKEYMEQCYGIALNVDSLDYQKYKSGLAGLDRQYESHPELRGYISEIKSGKGYVMASKGETLYLSEDYFSGSSVRNLDEMCKGASERGWWPKNSNLEHLVVHETAHSLCDYVDEALGVEKYATSTRCAKAAISRYKKEYKAEASGKKTDDIIGSVSRYAASYEEAKRKYSELCAEAYGDVAVNGDNAHPLSKMVVEEVEKAYKETKE